MPQKIIQISTQVNSKGMVVIYALDEAGDIYQKIVGVQNSPWTIIK